MPRGQQGRCPPEGNLGNLLHAGFGFGRIISWCPLTPSGKSWIRHRFKPCIDSIPEIHGKMVFLYLRQGNVFTPVCHSVHQVPPTWLDILRADTLLGRHLRADIPPWPDTLRADTPREKYMLGDTGNKRALRILLECILVSHVFWFRLGIKTLPM